MNEPLSASPIQPQPAPDRYDELDSILDDLRERSAVVPHWEFCEGFIAALLCCRRDIEPGEYLGVLLDDARGESGAEPDGPSPFADTAQFERFMTLWHERWSEIAAELDAEVETLADEGAYEPQLFDLRGLVASLPPEQRDGLEMAELPAFAQLWALGFMAVVDSWPEEWAPPRDKEDRRLVEHALETIDALTGDDAGPLDFSPYDDADAPSVSRTRFEQFGAALAAVYDLYDVFQSLGPRVEPLRKASEPGRNDPCWCGSGRKFKKCHGA